MPKRFEMLLKGASALEYFDILKAAISTLPRDIHLWMIFAKHMENLGHLDLASQAYDKILKIATDDSYALQSKILLIPKGIGTFAEGVEWAVRMYNASNLDKDCAIAKGHEAHNCHGAGRYEDGIRAARESFTYAQRMESDKDCAIAKCHEINGYLGLFKTAQKQIDQAKYLSIAQRLITDMLTRDPDSKIWIYQSAKLDFYNGNPGAASQKIRPLLEKNSDFLFKVLYKLTAPADDPLLAAFDRLLPSTELDQIVRYAREWQQNGREPEFLPEIGVYGGSNIWKEGSIRAVNSQAFREMGGIPLKNHKEYVFSK